MLAKREHEVRLPLAVKEAFVRASRTLKRKLDWQDLAAVAVTYGPGLAIALEVGIQQAKEMSLEHKIPLIGINHMEGHLLASLGLNSRGKGNLKAAALKYPVLGLLISGGHTEIILMHALGKYEVLGQTVDDAIGEAYDKVARMLGLGYPGGKVLTEFAKKGDPDKYPFPVPMSKDPGLNFSFSGLKTAVYYLIREKGKAGEELKRQDIYDIAAGFEKSAIAALQIKLTRAFKEYRPGMLLVGGGVGSSAKVRAGIRQVCQKDAVKVSFPYLENLYTDNGAMIAIAAYFKLKRGDTGPADLDRDPNLEL